MSDYLTEAIEAGARAVTDNFVTLKRALNPLEFAEAAVRAAAPIIERAARREGRLVRTWYRSRLADGSVWCESSNPAEVIHRTLAHPGASFELHDTYEVDEGWRPWTRP